MQHEKTFFLESSSSGFDVFSSAYTISKTNNNHRTTGIQNRNENEGILTISGLPKTLGKTQQLLKHITYLR